MYLELCAQALSQFSQICYASHNISTMERAGLWRAFGEASPVYFNAGTTSDTLNPGVPRSRLSRSDRALRDIGDVDPGYRICDVMSHLDLDTSQWEKQTSPPWMIRLPGAGQARRRFTHPLRIERVTTPAGVLQFERTVNAANGGSPFGHVDGAIHPPATTLRFPALTLFVGVLDDEPVSTALSCKTGSAVLVSAVSTLPDHRGKGFGARMTMRAVRSARHVPAVLQSTELGRSIYERLGFVEIGTGIEWTRRRNAPSVA